jgi:DedD protein
MEKRKLLLISISIGIFLVIIIGASILMFAPKEPVPLAAEFSRPIPPGNSGVSRNEPASPLKIDLTDMVKNPDEVKGLQTPPATPPAMPPSTSTVQENSNHIYINGEPVNINGATITEEQTAEGTRTRTNLVINVPSPQVPVVPEPVPAARTAPAASPPERPAAPPAVVAVKPKPAAPRPAAPAAAPKAPAAQTPRAPAGRTNFWVQAGSYSTQTRAEGVKETLAAKGIPSIIENRNVEGKTFYRVRVGPYMSNNEASYWLTLIKQISGFEDSQIWQNQSRL